MKQRPDLTVIEQQARDVLAWKAQETVFPLPPLPRLARGTLELIEYAKLLEDVARRARAYFDADSPEAAEDGYDKVMEALGKLPELPPLEPPNG